MKKWHAFKLGCQWSYANWLWCGLTSSGTPWQRDSQWLHFKLSEGAKWENNKDHNAPVTRMTFRYRDVEGLIPKAVISIYTKLTQSSTNNVNKRFLSKGFIGKDGWKWTDCFAGISIMTCNCIYRYLYSKTLWKWITVHSQ